jgi:hypothetical protein
VEEISSSSGSNCSRRKIFPIWNASAGGFKHHFLQRPVTLLTSATVSQRGTQAQTDAVIAGERSTALGLGSSSRIDTATTSLLSAMVVTKKKQIGKAPVAKKPEKKSSEDAENDMSLRRRYKLSPSS